MKNSSISITLKWSLAIALLITVAMAILGWVLIEQQTGRHLQQMEAYGFTIVEQLARSASEPLMADDRFSLEGLVSRQAESDQILGMGIYQINGKLRAKAGLLPDAPLSAQAGKPSTRRIDWFRRDPQNNMHKAISFISPVIFQDVIAGYALVTLDRESLDQGLYEAKKAIGIATLGLIAITILIAFALGRRLSRPIQNLVAAGEAIDSGQLDYRIPERRQDEIGQIIEAFNRMANGLLEKRQVEAALSRYTSPHVAKKILANLEQVSLSDEHLEGSVLFCDLVGYTELSENLAPDAVAGLLNEYYSYIAKACQHCHGMLDKFMGDCVMLVFGVSEADEYHALNAVTCALLIQQIAERLNGKRVEQGQLPLQFRIGINSGRMLAGNMGGQERMQYTVVGDTVNLAARLCPLADAGQIIISHCTAREVGIGEHIQLRQQPPIQVRGRSKPVTPMVVEAMNDQRRRHLDTLLEEIWSSESELVCSGQD